jgi:hypothetical protein
MRRAPVALVGVLIAGPFYLLLIDTVDLPELYAMIGVVAVAAGAFVVSARVEQPAFSLASLARGWRAVARIPLDVVVVSYEAVAQLVAPHRRSRSRFRTVPFDGSAADLAAEEYFGSLAPNQIVLEQEGDQLLVHELRPRRRS